MAKQYTLSHRTAISDGLKRFHEMKKKLGKPASKQANHKDWIAGATRSKGALRRSAMNQGLIKAGEKIPSSVIRKLERSKNPKTRKQAKLAQTLSELRKKADGPSK